MRWISCVARWSAALSGPAAVVAQTAVVVRSQVRIWAAKAACSALVAAATAASSRPA